MSTKENVELLLQRCKPKLLAVDLDNTLWPGNCFESTSPPYVCNRFQHAPRTVACLDPRTGQGRTISLYPDVRDILEFLSARNVMLTVCSRSPNKIAAEGILDTLGLWNLFTLPQVYRSRKTYHFRNLRDCLDVDYCDCLHFDDCLQNVEAVSAMGVVACPVVVGDGLTWERLLAGLQLFEESRSRRQSIPERVLRSESLLPMELTKLTPPGPTTTTTSTTAITNTILIPRKHVRWCLEPTYYEDVYSDPEKTDGDDSTDDSFSFDDTVGPSSNTAVVASAARTVVSHACTALLPVNLKRKHSLGHDRELSPTFASSHKKPFLPSTLQLVVDASR